MSVAITYTNRFFDILNPDNSDKIDIVDIAHSLSNKCRFNGHCRKFYSVAEHSVWCARLAPDRLKLSTLMHDASEAFLGDITGPLKNYWIDMIAPVENRLDCYMKDNFHLPDLSTEDKKIIKHIDKSMLLHEAYYLFDNPFSDKRFIWPNPNDVTKLAISLKCLGPDDAKEFFLSEYSILLERGK